MTVSASNVLLVVVLLGVAPACAASPDTGATPFSAALKVAVPGLNPASKATLHLIGACKPCSVGDVSCSTAGCAQLTLTEEPVIWEGLGIAGQRVKQSVWVGQGIFVAGLPFATGLEWTTLENGDTYVAAWNEALTPDKTAFSGTWDLLDGTGALKGITGQAKLTCKIPPPDEPIEICEITGSYTLSE